MMENAEIKDAFFNSLLFLIKLGYDKVKIYENAIEYKWGITLENVKINQKISVAFYEKNPLDINSDFEYGLLFKLFKDGSHIDISRLLKKDTELSKYSYNQYFIIPIDFRLEDFLKKIAKIIYESYYDILIGKSWIAITYDLRDDY